MKNGATESNKIYTCLGDHQGVVLGRARGTIAPLVETRQLPRLKVKSSFSAVFQQSYQSVSRILSSS